MSTIQVEYVNFGDEAPMILLYIIVSTFSITVSNCTFL